MRFRDGPAAVRGDALPPRRHWPTGREGGGGGGPESEDLPPPSTVRTPSRTGRKGDGDVSASRSSGDSGRCRARSGLRRHGGDRHGEGHAVPGDGHRREREGHDLQAADPDRLALAHRDRVALRRRRGLAGDRSRRSVRLPEERPEDGALRLHPERRGDRLVPTRPRRRHVRSQGSRGLADEARDPRPLPQGRLDLPWRVPADPSARPGDREERAGSDARRADEAPDRPGRREAEAGRGRDDGLPRARPELLLGDLDDVRRSRLRALRPEEHRGCGPGRVRVPAALAGVRDLVQPRPRRARRHGLLRPDGGDGRVPAGLVEPSRPCATARSCGSTTRSPRAGGRGS